MRKIYIAIVSILSINVYSQFIHVNPNKEVPGSALLVMNDGSTRNGFVKNNKADYMFLRILSQDTKAFSHANVEVDEILFKSEDEENYQSIPATSIKHIIITNDDEVSRYDRLHVYRLNSFATKVIDKKPSIMFQTPNLEDYFVAYSNIYINTGRGGGAYDVINYFVRLKDSEITYHFRFSPPGIGTEKYNIGRFKIFAPNNKNYQDYIALLGKKSSEERKEFTKLLNEKIEEAEGYYKQNKDNFKGIDKRVFAYRVKFDFMFDYIGKKLKEFSN